MTKLYAFVLVPLVLTLTVATAWGQMSGGRETVAVHSGSATLHAMLWRPQGRGPFPAILLNHGSGRTREDLERLGPYEQNAEQLGPVFAREMDDALSGLKFLRALPYVDARNVAAIGHSFGGSLTVLLAEREPNLRAVVVFSGAGYSFDRSPELRARLLAAIDHVAEPVFFIHAENDYSLSSGKVLDARREHIGKPHRLKIYPPIGHTVDDGHDFLHLGVNIWEPDVFAFLDENMRK
jgi:dienelactone hydrolase